MGEEYVWLDGVLTKVPSSSSKKSSIVDDELLDWVIREEGFLDTPTNIGDGKITLGSGLTDPKWLDLYKKRGNKWSQKDNRKAVNKELLDREKWAAKNVPNWSSLPDSSKKAMLSYKYNYNFTPANSPKLFKAMENMDFIEAMYQMDATSKDPKFKKGLEERRKREQEWGLSGIMSGIRPASPSVSMIERPDALNVNTSYQIPVDNTIAKPMYVTFSPDNYVEAKQIEPEEWQQEKAIDTFNTLAGIRKFTESQKWENQEPKRFVPTSGIDYTVRSYAEGGNLNRKKSWDELSIKERADMIRVAIENGITTLPEIKKQYNEFAEGGDTEEAYEAPWVTEAKEKEALRKKWLEEQTEKYAQAVEDAKHPTGHYLNEVIVTPNGTSLGSVSSDAMKDNLLSSTRERQAKDKKNASDMVRHIHEGTDTAAKVLAPLVAAPAAPYLYSGITGLMANPVVDAAFTVDGVINAPSRIREGIGDIRDGNYGSAAWNLGTTALDLVGGANLARRVPEGRRFIQDIGDRYQGMKDAEYFLRRQKTPEHVFDVANRNWINNGGNEAGLYKTGIKDNRFGTRYPDPDDTIDKTWFSDMVEDGGDMTLNVHLGGNMPTSNPNFVEIQPREQWIALNKYLKGVPSGTYFGEVGRTKNYAEQYLHTKPSRVKAFKDAVIGRKENNPLWQDEIDWYNTKLEEGDPLQIIHQKYLLDNNQPLTEDSYMFILKRAAKGDKGEFDLRYDSTPMGLFQDQGQVYKDFHNTLLEMSPKDQVKAINNWMHSVYPKARPAYLEDGEVRIPRPLLRLK